MSRTTRQQEALPRQRLELGRLRALGGLTRRVLVDGQAILKWCTGAKIPLQVAIDDILSAASDGAREVVLVLPRKENVSVGSPHRVMHVVEANFDTGIARNISAYLSAPEFARVFPGEVSLITANVKQYPETLAALSANVSLVLDVMTGNLHRTSTMNYDADAIHADGRKLGASLYAGMTARALAEAPTGTLAGVFVVARWHRQHGVVVLDEVAVERSGRRRAAGHDACLDLVAAALAQPGVPTITTSLDVMDALHAANRLLPVAVRDPALACVVVDPDQRWLPRGLAASWNDVLGERGESVQSDMERVLDELPGLMLELDEEILREGLGSLYNDDICATAPVFAAIESTGFRVDATNIAADVSTLEQRMQAAVHAIQKSTTAFSGVDLLRASKNELGERLVDSEGHLPLGWRSTPASLDRYVLFGNTRALAIRDLRSMGATLNWLVRISGESQLTTVLEPASTGRWYPRGTPLHAMPKHSSSARLLRQRLLPPPGYVLVSGDYAAFEPRLLAHFSQDPFLLRASQSPNNFYDEIASAGGLASRELAKAAWLAFAYGRRRIAFAESLPVPVLDGIKMFDALSAKIGVAQQYKRKFARQLQEVATEPIGGWRRKRQAGDSRQRFERRGFNLLMQGAAASLLRRVLRELRANLPAGVHLVYQEFDSVVLACPQGQQLQIEEVVKGTMENIATLSVPLRARMKHGATLADVS